MNIEINFNDNDCVVLVRRDGNELHLRPEQVLCLAQDLEDCEETRHEGHEENDPLEGVQDWLETASRYGHTPLTDPDNVQLAVVEDK